MLRENRPATEEQVHPTIVMKDHAFDRDLDDLGQSPEDLERQVEPSRPVAAERQEIVLLHH
jgi:hypothetical protein